MLDMTVGQLKARIIAHNIDRLKDVFAAEDADEGKAALQRVARAVLGFSGEFQKAVRTITAAALKVDEKELATTGDAARAARKGDQLRDATLGAFVTPTRNPNSHDYGAEPVLITQPRRGLRPDGVLGNNLPEPRYNALRPSTPAEVASWIRRTVDRLCGAEVENDATLRQVLDLMVARSPADDEPESIREARGQAMQVGCQTRAMQNLLEAIGRTDLVTNSATAPGRVIERRKSGAVLSRCLLVLGYDPDGYLDCCNSRGEVTKESWMDSWSFANQSTARAFLEAFAASWASALPAPAEPEAASPRKGKAPKAEKAPKKASRKKTATLAGAGS